jgi:hypothetical protein
MADVFPVANDVDCEMNSLSPALFHWKKTVLIDQHRVLVG